MAPELPPISILIPTFGAADKLAVCLESLRQHLPSGHPVYVLDDATPNSKVQDVCSRIQAQFPQLTYVRSENNLGFVAGCNWGNTHLRQSEHDLLILNSDTEVTSGFLDEMQQVLYLHEKHATVTPRSNSATIFSIPRVGERLEPNASFQLWQQIRTQLSRYRVMPTAVGFCLLIKAQVLNRFGLFDEIYSPGYNEENDFICRINRYGYSAVAANQAFVFHHESSSFGPRRADLESKHRQILLQRYPEYERKVYEYERFFADPVETFAPLMLPHRPRILYDLFHLPGAYTGTSDFGLNLLRELSQLMGEVDLYVGLRDIHHYFDNELTGYKIYRDRSDLRMTFDLVFKPCQVFSWSEFYRMNRLAPRVAYVVQDIIAVRCQYLNSAEREILFKKAAEISDRVFTISEFSRADFDAYYNVNSAMPVIHHGTNSGASGLEYRNGNYLLVMGNHFAHKGVAETLGILGDARPIVVLGGQRQPDCGPNVEWLESGRLSRSEMRSFLANARMLVYPSHYEGFGLPVVDALALGKPVVVLENSVNRELAALTQDPNLHRIDDLKKLPEIVHRLYAAETVKSSVPARRWRACATEYAAALRDLIGSEINVELMRKRWDTLRMIDAVGPLEPPGINLVP